MAKHCFKLSHRFSHATDRRQQKAMKGHSNRTDGQASDGKPRGKDGEFPKVALGAVAKPR